MRDKSMKRLNLGSAAGPKLAEIIDMPRNTPEECTAANAAYAGFRKSLETWPCAGCGTEIRGTRPAWMRKAASASGSGGADGDNARRTAPPTLRQREAEVRSNHCPKCLPAALEAFHQKKRNAMPLPRLLRNTRVPRKQRGRFDRARACVRGTNAWPRDHRRGFASVDLETWDGAPPILTITGPVGAGKTRFAVELFTRLLRRKERSGLFVQASELVQRGRDLSVERLLADARRRDVVLIDDVGRGLGGTHLGWHALSDLINHRWSSEGITILTTNMPITITGAENAARRARGLLPSATVTPEMVMPSLESSSQAITSRLLDGLAVQLDRPDQRGQPLNI
ncbi:MAG: hypothetical protein AAF968_00215 [Pseudomonadota bacterium]